MFSLCLVYEMGKESSLTVLKMFENLLLYTHSFFLSKAPVLSSSFIRAVVVAVQVSVQADRPDRGLRVG